MIDVSVLMPVRNAEKFVKAAIRSVLQQHWKDFELIVLDDASNDDTLLIVESFGDKRIRIIKHETSLGIARLLNHGIELSRGEFILRMDGDDIARPYRIRNQVEFMQKNPHLAISGTAARFFGEEPIVRITPPTGSECVKSFMIFDNPILHPTVIFRRSKLDRHSLRYRPGFTRAEDYDLWERSGRLLHLDNLDKVTMWIRVHRSSVTKAAGLEMERQTGSILRRGLEELGITASDQELDFHRRVGHGCRMNSMRELMNGERWLSRLISENQFNKRFQQNAFITAVAMVWFRVCKASAQLGVFSWKKWKRSQLTKYYRPSCEEMIEFFFGLVRHTLSPLSKTDLT